MKSSRSDKGVAVDSNATRVLTAHRTSHGDFAECARVSQAVLRALRTGSRWKDLSDVQVEALQMIAHKLHRIVCGDPNYMDHWTDIAGYAILVEQDLEKKNEIPTSGPGRKET